MLRISLFFVLFLSLASVVLAEPRVEWNKTYTSGSAVDIADVSYQLKVSTGNATGIMMTGPDETFLLGEGRCKKLSWWKLCYEEKTADQAVRLSLLDLRANITVRLAFDEDSPYDIYDKTKKTLSFVVGESIDASLTINNTGEEEVSLVQAELPLPEGLRVSTIDGCDEDGQAITFVESLRPNEAESCTFTLEAYEQIPWNVGEEGAVDCIPLQAQVTYTTYAKDYLDTSDEYLVQSEKPFLYDIYADNLTGLEPGKKFTLHYNFTNDNEDANLSIEFELLFGDYVVFVSKTQPNLNVEEDNVHFKKTLDYNQSYNYSVVLKIPYFNVSDVLEALVTYTFEGEDAVSFTKEFPFSTTQKDLFIYLGENLSFESGEDVSLNTTILNQYTDLTFKGYDVSVVANYLLPTPFTLRVPYSKQRTIFGPSFKAPHVDRKTTYPLTVGVVGTTEQGQKVITSKEFTITIVPIEGLLIEKTLSKPASLDTDAPEQSRTIFVYATNRNNHAITASFQEELPSYIYANGPTSATTTLYPGRKQLIYSYSIVLAKEAFEQLKSVTSYSYTYLGEDFEKEASILLDGLEELRPQSAQNTTVIPINQTSNTTSLPDNITSLDEDTPSSQEQDLNVLPMLIGSLIAFIIVLCLFIWRYVGRRFLLKKQHKQLLAKYQELLGEAEVIRKRRTDLQEEQSQIKQKLLSLQSHVHSYEEKLPLRMDKLDKKESDLGSIEKDIAGKHQVLQERIAQIQSKDKALTQREEELKKLIDIVEKEKSLLKHDDDLLNQDVLSLKNEQEHVTKELEKLHHDHDSLLKTIDTFKKKQLTHHKSSISSIEAKREQIHHYHQHLIQEEEKLREEFSKVQKDLQVSQEDLKEAEKIYKDASFQEET